MFETAKTRELRIPASQWLKDVLKRHATRIKMLREMERLRHLSDEHLRDIGLHRSGIDEYISDLHKRRFRR